MFRWREERHQRQGDDELMVGDEAGLVANSVVARGGPPDFRHHTPNPRQPLLGPTRVAPDGVVRLYQPRCRPIQRLRRSCASCSGSRRTSHVPTAVRFLATPCTDLSPRRRAPDPLSAFVRLWAHRCWMGRPPTPPLPHWRAAPPCHSTRAAKVNKYGFGAVVMPYKSFVCDVCKSAHQSFSHRTKSVAMSNWTMAEVRAHAAHARRRRTRGGSARHRSVFFWRRRRAAGGG